MSTKPSTDAEFAALWVTAQPMVSAYIKSVVRDFHQSEDLVQKVASIAFEKRAQYDSRRPFGAWVAGIARYELLHWRRSQARSRLVFTPETIEQIEQANTDLFDEFGERRAALRVCVDQLDPKGRRLIEMQYLRGLTPSQIAQDLGAKPATIRGAIHRIREVLHRCISRRVGAGAGASPGGEVSDG